MSYNNITIGGGGGMAISGGIVAQQVGQLNPGLAISGLNAASFQWNNNSHPWQVSDDMYVRKYEVIETSEDVLALSSAWYRLRVRRELDGQMYQPILNLLQKELFSLVEPCDRDNANSIRDYYSKKLMVWKLKEKRLSRFREDLNLFVHDTSKKISEKMLPIAYRLPEFYDYDISFDEMLRDVTKTFDHTPIATQPELIALKKFNTGKKANRSTEYWMKDSNSNLYLIKVQSSNPLKHLWEAIFNSGQSFKIKGDSIKRWRDEFQYRVFEKWELA